MTTGPKKNNMGKTILIFFGVFAALVLVFILVIQPIISRQSEERMRQLEETLAQQNREADEALIAAGLNPDDLPSPSPEPTAGPTVTLTETAMDIGDLVALYPLTSAPGNPSPQKFKAGSGGLVLSNNSLNHYVILADGANGFTDELLLFGLDLDNEVTTVKLKKGQVFRICPENAETMMRALGEGGTLRLTELIPNKRRIIPALAKAVYNNTGMDVYVNDQELEEDELRKIGEDDHIRWSSLQ